jgi:predicted esterase
MRRWILPALAVACLLPGKGLSQYTPADRFELGLRLRAVEAAWDAHRAAADRRRAIPLLNDAARAFLFSPRVGEIGRSLDRARFALAGPHAPERAIAWAASLSPRPGSRLLDAAAPELTLAVASFYRVETPAPVAARLRCTFLRGGESNLLLGEVAIDRVPLDVRLPLRNPGEGDYVLRTDVLLGEEVLARREQTVSLAARLAERLDKLEEAARSLPEAAAGTDAETVRSLARLLASLARHETLETNYPAARLLAEAEAAVRTVRAGGHYYAAPRAGEFWLTVPVNRDAVPVRLFAPEAVKHGKPLPLVIALHGAGGSENLFFDAYGRGAIVRLCRARGWLLVCPRGRLLDMTPPVEELAAAVGRLYPVDAKRVFLVGHSLGAMQAVGVAGKSPRAFAAVAALAGSGLVRPSAAVKDVPFFVGEGEEDGVLPHGGQALRDNLERVGVRTVRFRSYPDTEHLTVVEAALPDVFALFDEEAKR